MEKKGKESQKGKSEQEVQAEKIKELIHDLQRVQAEFENYKKRIEREQVIYTKHACETMIVKFLPILDHFQLAMHQKKQDDDFTKGIELIYAQFMELLEKEGIKKVEATGIFNPQFHEALLQEKNEQPKGTILEELQSGYYLGEKIIRPAKVKISAGK